jgi:hypothetical protein
MILHPAKLRLAHEQAFLDRRSEYLLYILLIFYLQHASGEEK